MTAVAHAAVLAAPLDSLALSRRRLHFAGELGSAQELEQAAVHFVVELIRSIGVDPDVTSGGSVSGFVAGLPPSTAPRPLSLMAIYDAILETARRQAGTTEQGRQLGAVDSGALDGLLRAVSASAASVVGALLTDV